MPKFMDFHPTLKLPPDAIQMLTKATREGTVDQFNVKQLELYYNDEIGGAWCVLEGPDEAAIHNHHNGLGVPVDGEVRPVKSLL
ncbi:MAG: DUF4242 domain-containing protein [Chloroflexi bacterium]|nr:DUF4242 domain-containing protein [Chloroflexota bacterium]